MLGFYVHYLLKSSSPTSKSMFPFGKCQNKHFYHLVPLSKKYKQMKERFLPVKKKIM